MQNKEGRKSTVSFQYGDIKTYMNSLILHFYYCLTDSVFPHVFGQQHAADHRDQKSSSAYRHQQKSITHWKVQTHRFLDLQDG